VSHPKAAAPIDASAIRVQLQRVLASPEFANAERMRRFLQLCVSEALDGRAAHLKEYTIGISVFDRPPSFDPGMDPIVRVEARRLRAKLEKYYSGEGRGDRIVIELPKGRYAAQFRRRDEAARSSPQQTNTIAVLPFQNLSPSPDGRYFSDGLTWELIHQLTRIGGLSVVAWNSAEQVRESPNALAAAARLKAGSVLTGSVRQSGGRLRIIAQLIDGATGVYLWSETYDRELQDIFAIEDDIARAIVSHLRARLATDSRVAKPTSHHNLEAYQLYLNGRAHWNQRTREGLLRSVECFRRAIEIDSNFALGYAGIADAHSLMADYGLGHPCDVVPIAKQAALRALEIDPSLGEAHCSLGLLAGMYEWNWAESERHFRRALELNPGYATAHHWLATDLLGVSGRFDEALEEVDIARRLDPLSGIISEGRGYMLMLARRYEESAEHYKSMAAADPSFHKLYTSLGRTLIQMGRYDDAIEQLEKGRQLAGGDLPAVMGALGQAYALKGERAEAARILSALEEVGRARYVPSTCFAILHIGLREHDRAIEWLERGLEQHELPMCNLAAHPVYDPLRGRPEFRVMLQRLGLTETRHFFSS
jgi:TolB-like protein/Flp pilus assembly protein TadD